MSIVSAVRTWLNTCPLLAGERINVDYLPESKRSYSVDVAPAESIIKRYQDGSTVRQFLFNIRTRNYFGDNIRQNIDNLGLCDDITAWVETESEAGRLPILGAGMAAQKVEVTSTGYVFITEADDEAQYQIQLRMTYYCERR